MRISRPAPENRQKRHAELTEAAQARLAEGRICGANCAATCPACGATNCQCQCSVNCPEAAAMMSADPAREPIEAGAIPLVFAMTRLELFQPCWSCEGHLGLDGALWKLPRVWFYAQSMVGVRLLSDGLKALEQNGRLQGQWHVVLTFSDPDNVETTFSLEPVTPLRHGIDLSALQRDMDIIADGLPGLIGSQARKLMRDSEAKSAAGEQT